MGRPFSLDLRERIASYVREGHSARAAGRLFGVSAATAVHIAAADREHGDVQAKVQGRPGGRSGELLAHMDFLLDLVRCDPDMTLMELAQALKGSRQVEVHHSSIDRALRRAGWSYKVVREQPLTS